MKKLPMILAGTAVVSGAAAMIIIATAPHTSLTIPTLIIAAITTFGALASAGRMARRSHA
jgi:hypothetical protein